MLRNADVVAFVPTRNAAEARAFYERVLGLEFVSEDPFALVFRANGVTVRPHKALAEMDPASGNMGVIQKAMNAETMKKLGTLSEGFISVETLVFAPSPEMSYPPDEWVKQDAKFWGRKAASMARAKAPAAPAKP